MTVFCQSYSLSHPSGKLSCSVFVDPTWRNLTVSCMGYSTRPCNVIKIPHLQCS